MARGDARFYPMEREASRPEWHSSYPQCSVAPEGPSVPRTEKRRERVAPYPSSATVALHASALGFSSYVLQVGVDLLIDWADSPPCPELVDGLWVVPASSSSYLVIVPCFYAPISDRLDGPLALEAAGD